MHQGLTDYVSRAYSLPPIHETNTVDKGFLSTNFILHTNTHQYFLKQYRFTTQEPVAAAHAAKHFFAARGIPVIVPLQNGAGHTFFANDGRYYALFPYVDGDHLPRGSFSRRALQSTAALLAKLHRAGRNVTLPHVRIQQSQKSYANFVETAHQILDKIPTQERTDFDELAIETIHLKLHLAAQNREAIAQMGLPSDHLLHGDYQDSNFFFDEDEQISHLFDWEKTIIGPRGLELARAIEFICFSNPHDYKALFSDENFDQAGHFLKTYHESYPISLDEFATTVHVRYLQKVLSLWVEADHYLENNTRVDPFLEAEYNTIQYGSHALAEYIERVYSMERF
ncbi:MAG: phosphotransferase [Caldilineaceae bacterium]